MACGHLNVQCLPLKQEKQPKAELEKVQTTIESSALTAICKAIATVRHIEHRNSLLHANNSKVGCFSMISDGNQAIFGGKGEMYDEFVKTKMLKNYPGEEEEVAFHTDDDYQDAKLKIIRFDQTFDRLPYDASDRKYCINVYKLGN